MTFSTHNEYLRLTAVRTMAYEAADVRLGNWLTADQGRCLLLNAAGEDLRSKRNYATLALFVQRLKGRLTRPSATSIDLFLRLCDARSDSIGFETMSAFIETDLPMFGDAATAFMGTT